MMLLLLQIQALAHLSLLLQCKLFQQEDLISEYRTFLNGQMFYVCMFSTGNGISLFLSLSSNFSYNIGFLKSVFFFLELDGN